jgi:hypothetical protein
MLYEYEGHKFAQQRYFVLEILVNKFIIDILWYLLQISWQECNVHNIYVVIIFFVFWRALSFWTAK